MQDNVLNLANPINRAAPLNRGLISRWQVLPQVPLGSRLLDLCGKNHGTLAYGAKRSGNAGRIGGSGSMIFRGGGDLASNAGASQDRVDLAEYTMPLACTVAVWLNGTTTTFNSSNGRIVFIHGLASAVASTIRLKADGAGVFHDSANGYGAEVTFTPIPANSWGRLCMTWNGGSGAAASIAVYINGKPVSTSVATDTLNSSTYATNAGKKVGRIAGQTYDTIGGYQGYWSGRLDHLCEWGRALTASEVQAEYLDSLQGSPQTLNWLDRPWLMGVPAAVGGNRRRRVLLGSH